MRKIAIIIWVQHINKLFLVIQYNIICKFKSVTRCPYCNIDIEMILLMMKRIGTCSTIALSLYNYCQIKKGTFLNIHKVHEKKQE